MASGIVDKVMGTIKEIAGRITGSRRLEAEGRTDRAKGEVKEAGRDAAEAAKGVRDSLQGDRRPH
jgi:uncharacterized protein YjbJ (UPF0337 family)